MINYLFAYDALSTLTVSLPQNNSFTLRPWVGVWVSPANTRCCMGFLYQLILPQLLDLRNEFRVYHELATRYSYGMQLLSRGWD
jgi:hypothetical protein